MTTALYLPVDGLVDFGRVTNLGERNMDRLGDCISLGVNATQQARMYCADEPNIPDLVKQQLAKADFLLSSAQNLYNQFKQARRAS